MIDLRGNGGGYLDASVHAANDILPSGKHVLTEKSRTRGDIKTDTLKSNPELKDKKIIILINGGTASASEILAGAVKFNKPDVKIIGSKTYGKGTVQNTWTLDNGGALKITTEYWLLPNGQKLENETPILPDIEIKQDQDALKNGRDNVLEESLKQF